MFSMLSITAYSQRQATNFSLMAPPARTGLSVANRNQNVAQQAGKLSRQHGSSNLLKENVKRGLKDDRGSKVCLNCPL